MDAIEQRRRLNSAVARRDGPEVVAFVGDGPSAADALQVIGHGLLVALAQRVEGAQGASARCVAALRDRDWLGDEVLAQQLGAALGARLESELEPLPVDLDDLSSMLEGDPLEGGGRIDRQTGEVWHQAVIDYACEMGEEDEDESDNAERWLWVHCEGSSEAYHDMELFIGTLADDRLGAALTRALEGRGPFRRFRDELARWPDEFTRWHQYSDERRRGRARAWLAEHGYLAVPAGEVGLAGPEAT